MRRVGRMALILSGIAVVLLLCWRQFAPGVLVEVLEGDSEIEKAFTERRSGIIVEVEGPVLRDLLGKPQDMQQRFVIGLRNGHRLVVSHDLEFADEVPVARGDTVRVRGEYTWSEHGGTVSRTHRDPGFGVRHGWIEHQGERYD